MWDFMTDDELVRYCLALDLDALTPLETELILRLETRLMADEEEPDDGDDA